MWIVFRTWRAGKKWRGLRGKIFAREPKRSPPPRALSAEPSRKLLAELEKEESQAKEQAETTIQNLKTKLLETERKLGKLLDVYLGETITAKEYASRKEKLVGQKVSLRELIQDFE